MYHVISHTLAHATRSSAMLLPPKAQAQGKCRCIVGGGYLVSYLVTDYLVARCAHRVPTVTPEHLSAVHACGHGLGKVVESQQLPRRARTLPAVLPCEAVLEYTEASPAHTHPHTNYYDYYYYHQYHYYYY